MKNNPPTHTPTPLSIDGIRTVVASIVDKARQAIARAEGR